MAQELKSNRTDMHFRIAKLQRELDSIKEEIGFEEDGAIKEIEILEQASAEDTADFFEKNNL